MATLVQAVRLALHYGETHLGVTDIFGEDVGPPLGGAFTATQGLQTAWNSPLDERGIIGAAMGIAYAGGRPVPEIQFCAYGLDILPFPQLPRNPRWADVTATFVALGVAAPPREGNDDTVISYGRTLPLSLQAADELGREHGLSFDVIDLRSIFPYDCKALSRSVLKTGRALIVNEDTEVTNFGEHLLRRLIDEHFYDLLVRPRVLLGKHLPVIGLE